MSEVDLCLNCPLSDCDEEDQRCPVHNPAHTPTHTPVKSREEYRAEIKKVKNRIWHLNHKEERREYMKNYWYENKSTIQRQQREYYERNKEKIQEKNRKRRRDARQRKEGE